MINEINCSKTEHSVEPSAEELAWLYYEKAMELSSIPFDIRCEQALPYLDQAIALNPNYPGFYYQKASVTFHCLGHYETYHSEAIDLLFQNLDKAIALNPDFFDAHCKQGEMHYLRGFLGTYHPNANLEMLEKAIQDLEIAYGLGQPAAPELEYAKMRLQYFSLTEK